MGVQNENRGLRQAASPRSFASGSPSIVFPSRTGTSVSERPIERRPHKERSGGGPSSRLRLALPASIDRRRPVSAVVVSVRGDPRSQASGHGSIRFDHGRRRERSHPRRATNARRARRSPRPNSLKRAGSQQNAAAAGNRWAGDATAGGRGSEDGAVGADTWQSTTLGIGHRNQPRAQIAPPGVGRGPRRQPNPSRSG